MIKIPKARKLKSGNWFIQLRIDGKSHSITASTKSECEMIALKKKIALMESKTESIPNITLNDAIELYLDKRTNVLFPSTLRGYYGYQKNRFKNYMNKPIKELTDCQLMVNEEINICSPKTVKNAYMFVAEVLKSFNVPIKKINLPQVPLNEHPFLQPDEIKIFVSAIEGNINEIPMLIALHGLRRSEILALRKENVHHGKIYIEGSVVEDSKGNLVNKKTNKNATSRRVVPILIPRLSELVDKLEPNSKICKASHSLYSAINHVCEKNNLPKVGCHGLRHSYISLCAYLQISESYILRTGGYSNPATMKKVYTHLADLTVSESETKLKNFFSENS